MVSQFWWHMTTRQYAEINRELASNTLPDTAHLLHYYIPRLFYIKIKYVSMPGPKSKDDNLVNILFTNGRKLWAGYKLYRD